jgi:hypothetical protein
VLDRALRVSESELGRDLQRDQIAESGRQRGLDRKAQSDEARKSGVRSTQAATKTFQRQQQQIREANTEQDRIRLANSAAESAAALAVTQGSAEAASYFLGIRDAEGNPTTEGATIWDSMSEAAKTDAYQQMIADENTQGTRWNAGSYANMVGKYGQNNSDHILHAEHMVGMDEAQRKGYLEQLQTESLMSGAAMDASDIKKVELFYAEIDAANKAQQASNRIMAEESRKAAEEVARGGLPTVQSAAPNFTPEEIAAAAYNTSGAGLGPMGSGATSTAGAPQTTLSPGDLGFDWSTSKAGRLAKELAGIVGFGPKA